jgi:F0F1-type ATP synthase assembly protein I
LKPDGKGAFQDYRRYMGLGFVIPVSVGLGCLAGWYADGFLGTEPWLLIAGATLGMVVGFVSFISIVLKGEQETQKRDRQDEQR